MIPVCLGFLAFAEFPITTVDIFSDLLNTFQIFLLLVSLLITYKIINLSESDMSRLLKNIRNVFTKLVKKYFTKAQNGQTSSGKERTATADDDIMEKLENTRKVDDIEAAAYLAAHITEVIVHKLPMPRDN